MNKKYFSIFFVIISTKLTLCQVSGDFWWLHKETKKLSSNDIPEPKFENVSITENDETDKIVFNKNQKTDVLINNTNDPGVKSKTWTIYFPDMSAFMSANLKLLKNNTPESLQEEKNITKEKDEKDLFTFHFPDESAEYTQSKTKYKIITTTEVAMKNTNYDKNIIPAPNQLFFSKFNNQINNKSESICSFVGIEECILRNGSVHKQLKRYQANEKALVCCILPIKNDKIVFLDSSENGTLKLRRTIRATSRLFSNKGSKIKRKCEIVSPDYDYEDPYVNIRNQRGRTKKSKRCDEEEYTEELPSPGMLGYYDGDDDYWPSSEDNSEVSEEGDSQEGGYGAPTVNPRLGHRAVTKRPKVKTKPTRLSTTTSNGIKVNIGTTAISYNSNPDFLVLKGFKLLNLVRNSTRFSERRTTQPAVNVLPIKSAEYIDYTDSSGLENNQYCSNRADSDEDHFGIQNNKEGSPQPWRGWLVRRKAHTKTACYATLVHPRAAVTVASCVINVPTGQLTFYIGSKSSDRNNKNVQRRNPSIRLHSRYTYGSKSKNLAILYWAQPLKLNANVRPICLADPKSGETCMLHGLSRQDHDSQTRTRQQRALVLNVKNCDGIPDVFCAIVKNEFLTRAGSPLVCSRDGHARAVGLASPQPGAGQPSAQVLLQPLATWTHRQLHALRILT